MKNSVPLAPLQKYARFILIVFAIALVLFFAAVPFLAWHRHMTLAAAALPAFGMFGVCGLWGIGDYICDPRKLDEREALINQRAITLGMKIFWLVIGLSCMGVWAVLSIGNQHAKVSVEFLPFLFMLGFIVFTVTQSIAILVQYKRSASDDSL